LNEIHSKIGAMHLTTVFCNFEIKKRAVSCIGYVKSGFTVVYKVRNHHGNELKKAKPDEKDNT
jgi:hypothetical protein